MRGPQASPSSLDETVAAEPAGGSGLRFPAGLRLRRGGRRWGEGRSIRTDDPTWLFQSSLGATGKDARPDAD